MEEDRQLIWECEFEGKIGQYAGQTDPGHETRYFYDDMEWQIQKFQNTSEFKKMAARNAKLSYFGPVRPETIFMFKRDPQYMHCVSSYEDTDPENNPLKNGKFSF